MSRLRKTYCGKMDVEYMHMNSREKCMGSEEGGKPGVAQVLQYTWYSKKKKLDIFERCVFLFL